MDDQEQDTSPESSMQPDDVRAIDMRGSDGARAPKKTWFFKRGDGKIIAAEATEAWEIVYNRSTWRRHDFKFIGASDGTTYARVIREGRIAADRIAPEIEKIRQELARYERAEENLLTNEAVDMEGDPEDKVNEENKGKVFRLQKIIERLKGQLAAKEEEYRLATKGVVQAAFDAELAEAKKNPGDWPDESMNIITPGASPKRRRKILSLIEEAPD